MTPLDISISSQLLGYTITHIMCIYIHARSHLPTHTYLHRDTCTYKHTHTPPTHTEMMHIRIKAVVLATAATVLAVPLFSQPASWNHTIRKLYVYLVRDIAITF